ncbi:MAG: MFS transporter [Clostridia bacterium]|nr:MFS transporter [Clostridia bacterium]
MEKNYDLKKAFKIGFVCIFTYLINYYIRKLLPVLSTDMIGSGEYTEALYALMSSTYMIAYAVGQLINGVIGDYIKPKYMVSLGLTVSSAGLFVFSFVSSSLADVVAFGIIGFGLSMMRGPLVKVISENTKQKYARVCCTFLSFVSFSGPLLVGLVAAFMDWKTVFVFSAFFSLAIAIFAFVTLTLFEKKGMIVPIEAKGADGKREKGSFWSVFKLDNFVLYIFIGIIVETMAISLDQWLTIFFTGHLAISEATSKSIFYVISILRAICPFLSLLIFKIVKGRDLLLIRIAYTVAACLFVLMFFIGDPWVNVVLLTLALMCASVASATMWSIYIPSLGKSGKVSGVNGILDSFGYAGASVMNLIFAVIWTSFSGGGLILTWAGFVAAGAVITLFGKKRAVEE